MVATSASRELPTPSELVDWLDRHVHGQSRAKWDLAVAVYTHYAGRALRGEASGELDGPGPQHVLLIGPTGVGKTLLLRTLARRLDVPVAYASATSLVETGYVGEPVEGLLRSLFAAAGGNHQRAERGIVFVDEIDKIRRAADVSRDVSGEGVQNGLLTLLDGREVPLRRDASGQMLDSRRVLFVCAGAFVGLERLVAARRATSARLGFAAPREEPEPPSLARDLTTEDLVRFGLIPELVGRFATIGVLEPLAREDLVAVLSRTRGSPLERQRALYRLHGIELEVEPPAFEALAERALQAGLGARGLARGLSECLRSTTAHLPELAEDGVVRVVVEARSLLDGEEPRLVRGASGVAIEQVRGLRRAALTTGAGVSAQDRLRRLEAGALRVVQAGPQVLAWWRALPGEVALSPADLLRLAEELSRRDLSIAQLHQAWQHSGTRDALANVHYAEYERRKALAALEPGPPPAEPPPGQGSFF